MRDIAYKCFELEDRHWWYVGHRIMLNSILSKLKKVISTIDIGCGTGYNFELFRKYSINVYGIDIKKLSQNPNIFVGDFNSFKFTEYYDRTIMVNLLEHCQDDIKTLKKAMEISNEIVLTIPAYNFLFSDWDKECMHYRRYSIGQLKKVVKNADLKLVYARYFNSFALLPFIITRIFLKKSGLQRIPNKIINNIIIGICWLEKFIRLPFGCSIIAVVKKC